MPASKYDSNELDDLEDLAGAATPAHLKSAEIYILGLCKGQVTLGIVGGYSLFLRGSNRQTTDIDLYVEDTMRRVKEVVETGDRVIRPASGLAEGVYRIFIRTGGEWDDLGGEEQPVEIDLMPQGGMISGTIEMIKVDGLDVPVLDIGSMLKNKLKSLEKRDSDNDCHDVEWIINNYPSTVASVHNSIDYNHREYFIAALDERGTPGDEINRYKQALGVTWPRVEDSE